MKRFTMALVCAACAAVVASAQDDDWLDDLGDLFGEEPAAAESVAVEDAPAEAAPVVEAADEGFDDLFGGFEEVAEAPAEPADAFADDVDSFFDDAGDFAEASAGAAEETVEAVEETAEAVAETVDSAADAASDDWSDLAPEDVEMALNDAADFSDDVEGAWEVAEPLELAEEESASLSESEIWDLDDFPTEPVEEAVAPAVVEEAAPAAPAEEEDVFADAFEEAPEAAPAVAQDKSEKAKGKAKKDKKDRKRQAEQPEVAAPVAEEVVPEAPAKPLLRPRTSQPKAKASSVSDWDAPIYW